MHKIRLTLLASGLALALPVSASAQSAADVGSLSPEERRADLESMSPDERAAMREKWRAERQAMSDEDRAAYGLVADDTIARPPTCTIERPTGSLRSLHVREQHDDILDLLAAVAPAWDAYVAVVEPIA